MTPTLSSKTLRFVVKSPAGILFEREKLHAVRLLLPDGKAGIRPGHAHLIAEISEGDVLLDSEENSEMVAIRGGIAVVKNDVIVLYTYGMDENGKENGKVQGDRNTEWDDDEIEELYEAIFSSLRSDGEQEAKSRGQQVEKET